MGPKPFPVLSGETVALGIGGSAEALGTRCDELGGVVDAAGLSRIEQALHLIEGRFVIDLTPGKPPDRGRRLSFLQRGPFKLVHWATDAQAGAPLVELVLRRAD